MTYELSKIRSKWKGRFVAEAKKTNNYAKSEQSIAVLLYTVNKYTFMDINKSFKHACTHFLRAYPSFCEDTPVLYSICGHTPIVSVLCIYVTFSDIICSCNITDT